LDHATLNFKNWRIVDVDNFMGGNPPFSDFVSGIDWNVNVESFYEKREEEAIDI